jgi:hypothetical protein
MALFRRKKHRLSRAAREAELNATTRRSGLLDLIGGEQGEMTKADAEARKQVGLSGDLFLPSGGYNPAESEAKARARGLRAASQARIDELKRMLGEPV